MKLIHGTMEDTGYYSSAADIPADKYTVVPYDRQCNSRSPGDPNIDVTVRQHVRDAVYYQGYGR